MDYGCRLFCQPEMEVGQLSEAHVHCSDLHTGTLQ